MKPRDTSTIWPFSLFGGVTGTARALEKAPTTVQYWVDQSRIPQNRWDDFIAAAKDIGEIITADELYNMCPAETAVA